MPGIGGGKPDTDQNLDVNGLVQQVLRQSYLDATEDLRDYAEKVRSYNQRKQALRGYLNALRKFKTQVNSTARERGVDLCRRNTDDLARLVEVIAELAHDYKQGDVERELCIPGRVPPEAVDSLDLLAEEIADWEARLASVGDDAQLANIDLQNVLQKQQQALQLLSNVSKLMHDSAMSIIRKIDG